MDQALGQGGGEGVPGGASPSSSSSSAAAVPGGGEKGGGSSSKGGRSSASCTPGPKVAKEEQTRRDEAMHKRARGEEPLTLEERSFCAKEDARERRRAAVPGAGGGTSAQRRKAAASGLERAPSFVQGLKEGEGAAVFDFEHLLREELSFSKETEAVDAGSSASQPAAAARDREESCDFPQPRSQAQLNRAAVKLINLLPSLGVEFSPIFNEHQADTDVGSQSAGCEGVGVPVQDEKGLRQQVELAHPDAARRCDKENGKGVFNPWWEEEGGGVSKAPTAAGGTGGARGGAGKKVAQTPPAEAEEEVNKRLKRAEGQRLVKGVYGFFNALICALLGNDNTYEATEVSLLRSLPGCPRQAGHGDYPIDVLGSDYIARPHFSILVPACDMPAHLWLWPGSHKLMEQVLNSNSDRGQHASGADFYIGSLQRLTGMKPGKTIAPEDVVVGGGQACAFLGHVVHAGAESQCAVATHYRWHCYVQRKGTSKENNSANGLPRGVSAICSDSLRMVAAGLHDE